MAENDAGTGLTPPYVPYKTLKGYLSRLKSTAIPSAIDGSVMAGLSGSARSEIRTAFRFLGLVTDDGTVTPELRQLAHAINTENWQNVLADRLSDAYAGVLRDLDLDTATLAQLRDKFRTGTKADGSVLPKALRFYLTALEDAGLSFSPHLKARGALSNGGKNGSKRSVRQKTGGANSRQPVVAPQPEQRQAPSAPPGTVGIPVHLPGKTAMLYVPPDMTSREWNFIDAYIRGYIELRTTETETA